MSARPSGETLFGLYGAGGIGREIMSFVKHPLASKGVTCYFVDDNEGADDWHGITTLTPDQFLAQDADELLFNVSVSDSRLRAALVDKMSSRGARLISLFHENAYVGSGVEIGAGAVVCAFSTLTADCRIGRNFQCNNYSYVAHDCVIGDNVTFAPSVRCNGNVQVGDHAYIGTGAVIRQGSPGEPLMIGEGAVVGMGAVVTKPVAAYSTVVGNPARTLPRK